MRARRERGDVAVLRGPLTIAGHVTGSVLAVNSDVLLRPTARIDGQLLVVGGEVEGRNASRVDGAIRIYRQSLAYREDGQRIVATDEESVADDESWWHASSVVTGGTGARCSGWRRPGRTTASKGCPSSSGR
jgi:hypothetical protein